MAGPNYLTAPLKAITREMIAELSRRTVSFGPLSEMTYVGLGSLEFVDFELFYRRLGIMNMISIESNYSVARLEFNRPFDGIRIIHGHTNLRLPEIGELKESRCIVWLDFTARINASVRRDISYLASVLPQGSALFISLNMDVRERDIESVMTDLGDYFNPDRAQSDYLGAVFGDRQREIAERIVRESISGRNDSVHSQLVLDVRYADSSKMQVLGWILSERDVDIFDRCRLSELDFSLAAKEGRSVRLGWPKITSTEWIALTKNLLPTQNDSSSPFPWIDQATINHFVNIHRWGSPPTFPTT